MAFKHGKNTEVWLNGTDLSVFFNSAEFSADVDTGETSTFKATWKTHIAGKQNAKVDVGGFYDPTNSDLPSALGVDAGVLTVCPAGALAIGDLARLLSITSTAYTESSPVGGVVAVKWAAMSEATVGFGQALHILTEDTNTTTGASKDDAASSATGWTAHLHVTAVDAGSWVIKLQDSPDNSAWSDVTGGAFTAATAATGQRLSSAAATTALARYVRYVATRTGGAGGDGITFALAYSRN